MAAAVAHPFFAFYGRTLSVCLRLHFCGAGVHSGQPQPQDFVVLLPQGAGLRLVEIPLGSLCQPLSLRRGHNRQVRDVRRPEIQGRSRGRREISGICRKA